MVVRDSSLRRAARLSAAVVLGLTAFAATGCASSEADTYQRFGVQRSQLANTGRNPFFVLEPGYQMSYASGAEQLVITVMDQTEPVDSVNTRVVEERETKDGVPVEVSRNYFAIDPATNDVYYFGEDVDEYEGGKVTAHGGSWRAGVGGARFGLAMPGQPKVGFQHDQEVAPGVALDHSEIVSTTETVPGPSGPLTDCLKVKETTPLEPGVVEYKLYAPGIGLVRDGELALVRYGKAG